MYVDNNMNDFEISCTCQRETIVEVFRILFFELDCIIFSEFQELYFGTGRL